MRTIKKILGCLLVKNCVLLDPEDATPILSIPMNASFPSVPQDEPLLNMLNAFREGRSHMALVSRRTNRPVESIGVGDNVEEESVMTAAALGLRERIKRKLARSESSSDSEEEPDLEMGQVSKSREQIRKESKMEGQGLPGDALMQPAQVDEVRLVFSRSALSALRLTPSRFRLSLWRRTKGNPSASSRSRTCSKN